MSTGLPVVPVGLQYMDNTVLKKIVMIDLDGVLNNYSGNYDKNIIPPAKVGAEEFLEKLSENYELKLFTTRNKELAQAWLVENGFHKYIKDVTNVKEPAWLYVDDRAITFRGDYNNLLDEIKNFQVWYKR